MKKLNVGTNHLDLKMPLTEKTTLYLEGSHNTHQRSCYTIIDAAVNETGNELILLLENDREGEEDMAIAFLPINIPLATIRLAGDKPIGAYNNEYAFLIKKQRWCEAYNGIDVELDDRCYENYTILTREEINEV